MRPPRTHARRPKPSGAGRGIHVWPCDSTRNSNPSPPLDAHSPSLLLHANQGATDNSDETRDCAPPTDDRATRDPAELSREASRTAPSPSFHFILVGRNAAKATSKSGVEVDGGPRVQIRAPRPCRRPRGPPGASIEAGEAEILESKSRASPSTCDGSLPAFAERVAFGGFITPHQH